MACGLEVFLVEATESKRLARPDNFWQKIRNSGKLAP
jgi:hypothetical protein